MPPFNSLLLSRCPLSSKPVEEDWKDEDVQFAFYVLGSGWDNYYEEEVAFCNYILIKNGIHYS